MLRALIFIMLFPAMVVGQATRDEAADRARIAWLEHDIAGLLAGSDPVTLGLPGVEATRPLSPGQVAALIREFLRNTEELGFSYDRVVRISDDQGYIDAVREYVIVGTTEVLTQKVLIGFRRLRRVWRIYEIRIHLVNQAGGLVADPH